MTSFLILGLSRIVKKRVLTALYGINDFEYWECATVSHQQDAKQLGAKAVYSSYAEALTESNAKWVYISLPNSLHAKWIRSALENNKNVIVDKPAVIDIQIGKELLAFAKSRKLMLSEAMTFGFHNQFDFAKLLFEKRGNNIQHAHMWFVIPNLPDSDFRSDSDLGGGAVWDMGAYALGAGRVLLNDLPTELEIVVPRNTKNLGSIKSFSILALYASGAQFTGNFGFGFEYTNSITITGQNLRLELFRPFSLPENIAIQLNSYSHNCTETHQIVADDSFANYLRWVLDANVSDNKELVWNHFEEGLCGIEMLCNRIKFAI